MFISIPTAADSSSQRLSVAQPRATGGNERTAAADRLAADRAADGALDDVRSNDPVERLLEDSWDSRSRVADARELSVEAVGAALFLCFAAPLAASGFSDHPVKPLLAVALVALYAIASRLIKFPIGAGYVVPTYLVLVPMLLLLPPGVVPLLTAAGLLAGTLAQVAGGRSEASKALSSIPDAWHSLGPATVLVLAGPVHGVAAAGVYLLAFGAGCLIDLVSATIRERAILGIGGQVQLRVIAQVWLIDASLAPLGLLIAHAAQRRPADLLLLLPFDGLLLVLSRDRNARIEQAQRRLDVVARERRRLQSAVGRLGEALAAKLDLTALTDIVLRGSIEALDAEAGRLTLSGAVAALELESDRNSPLAPALRAAADAAQAENKPCRLSVDGVRVLALPFGFSSDAGLATGAIAVARAQREFLADEEDVMAGLVERARVAAADIVAHRILQEQAFTDPLTKLGNRRALSAELQARLGGALGSERLLLLLFDLDGFKSYNDTFGHPAGDALLARLGGKLESVVSAYGAAYRLGGDEFCALVVASEAKRDAIIADAVAALSERGENFAVGASYGAVALPEEATGANQAMELADERMYARKRGRASSAGDQTRDVLVQIIQARKPELHDHSSEVAQLCRRVGVEMELTQDALAELARAAELHDVGKVAVPDAILGKREQLTEDERAFVRHHVLLGERILNSVSALRGVASLVRSTHEHWDGGGYPDGLSGEAIPVAARIIAACDAYVSMRSDRSYRAPRGRAQALDELRREAGRQFDPRVVAALLRELGDEEVRTGRCPESRARALRDALAEQAAARAGASAVVSVPAIAP
jgi:diguanylate cyclase (GGDEF)-like protein